MNPNTSAQEAIDLYLTARPDSNLGYVVDPDHQMKKLQLVADDILETFLEHKAYNCEFVRVFMREVLSKLILDATANSCSRADWINDWIVYALEDSLVDAGKIASSTDLSVDKLRTPVKQDSIAGQKDTAEQIRHRRVVSKAQEAMDDAMQEAARLTQMIAEEDARRTKGQSTQHDALSEVLQTQETVISQSKKTIANSTTSTDDTSESVAPGMITPTSSQSDQHRRDDSSPVSTKKQEVRESGEFKAPVRSSVDAKQTFTSFDQIVPQDRPTALLDVDDTPKKEALPLTVHNATIVLMDDSNPSDRSAIKNKPVTEYLIQVEPSTSYHSGWMIVRKYHDFEPLHEVLSKIAKVTDAKKFADSHPALPPWKGSTKPKLRDDLERYLIDAVQHQSLAECAGLKRFLEKDIAVSKTPVKQSFPKFGGIENVGKGVVDVISSAPKGVASGGKSLLGGVNSVLGGGKGPKKAVSSTPPLSRSGTSRSSLSLARSDNPLASPSSARQSHESLRAPSPLVEEQPAPHPQMEKPAVVMPESPPRPKEIPRSEWEATPILGGDQFIHLPPPPSDIPDDYKEPAVRQSFDGPVQFTTSTNSSVGDLLKTAIPEEPPKAMPPKKPLTEQEAQIAIELGLASITEFYKLSSAWSVRLALLNAAKAILVRPGNAQLESIRQLIQDTVLDANTSDAGIAAQIRAVRANTLPTETELAGWPKERTPEQKEELRQKARKLLLERGMPQALNSVMGQAASAEALGKVFDALQVQKIAKGLIFGLMLQALRAVTQ